MGKIKFVLTKEERAVLVGWYDHLRFIDRFHLPEVDEQLVCSIVDYSIQQRPNQITPDENFYRARVNAIGELGKKEPSQMGAPPRERSKAGRLNPVGIPYLYLSSDLKTSIAEVRPRMGALVSVARFVVKRPLQIVNLNYRDVKPAEKKVQKGDPEEYKRFILFISQTLARPQDHPDDEISYIPTQYFAEKFKRRGIDGVMYQSVLKSPGSNLVLFNPNVAEAKETFLYRVKKSPTQKKK